MNFTNDGDGLLTCECGWRYDGRMRPKQDINAAADDHAMGHGQRWKPMEPGRDVLMAVFHDGNNVCALDRFGEWWFWMSGEWGWLPYGPGNVGSLVSVSPPR